MDHSIKNYLRVIRTRKKQKRRLTSFITAMSVFVSAGVFWQLRGIGTAMTDITLRSEDGKTAVQLSDADSALCETSEIWESTLPPLTDDLAENTALVAASQIDYTENTNNFITGDDGAVHKNYSRYGAWFGNPYGDWNCMFTCFCLYYAGVKEADIPYGSGCWAWSLKLSENGILIPFNKGSPKRGDIIFFDNDLDGKADRSGIISELSTDHDDPFIRIIEGQVNGAVAECSFPPDDVHIAGYVPVNGTVSKTVSFMDLAAESSSGIKVYASAEQGIFPEDTEMAVSDVARDEALKKAADALGTQDVEAVAVDISFLSPDGTELEPADSSCVHVEIVLPEEQKLSGEGFSLLHVTDSGETEMIENADVSGEKAIFDADSFSIYVLTSGGYKDIASAITVNGQTIPNSADNPYVLYVGDTVKLEGYTTHDPSTLKGWFFGTDGTVLKMDDGSHSDSRVGSSRWKHSASYTAQSVGTTSVSIDGGTEGYTTFYVKVVDRPRIYVNTSLGEKDKDQVHEYLGSLHAGNPDDYFVYQDGKRKYIKNGDDWIGYNNDGSLRYDGGLRPYRISTDDTIELVTYCSPAEADTLDFNVGSKGTHTEGTNSLEKLGDSVKELVTSGEHQGEVRISSKFRSKASNGTGKTGVALGDDFFYIIVNADGSEEDIKTHADIEIDDGGFYIIEEYSFDESGKLEKTITQYSAFVSDINSCRIFDKNGAPTKFLKSTASDKSFENKDVEFTHDDYTQYFDLNQSSQYELTSNYVSGDNKENESFMKFGDFYLRGNKNFSLKDAQRADFNVDLRLKAFSKVKEIYDQNGTYIETQTLTPESGYVSAKGLHFSLGRQNILDAYNKCPVRTGLDFTLAANAVMVDFQLKKELIDDDIGSRTFDFQLLDENNNVIAEARNDTNGIISFSNIYFSREGTYTYTVHETGNSDNDIIFADDRKITFTVTRENGMMNASVEADDLVQPIKNYKTFRLPDTGGSGIVPYMTAGSAIVIFSFVALMLRKRKEDK